MILNDENSVQLNLTVDGVTAEHRIPNSWKGVTVKQFMNFSNLNLGNNPITVIAEVLSTFSTLTVDDIWMIPADKFQEISQVLDFVKEEIKDKPVDSLIIDGEEYFLKKDFTQLLTGEVITIETIINDADGNLNKVLDKLLCVFLRRKINGELESFKVSMLEERVEYFHDISIADVYKIFSFFLNGNDLSTPTMKEFSETEKIEKTIKNQSSTSEIKPKLTQGSAGTK